MSYRYFNRSKYHNKKTVIGDIVFDSKKEAIRWQELQLLQKNGKIDYLERQKSFELIPTLFYGEECVRGSKYVVDFFYFDCAINKWVAEDTKGMKLDTYILKKKLFLQKYVYEKNLVFIEGGKPVKVYQNTNFL